mmetsp:Transcript_38930/g.82922  ORF Transcript_38930/g.82922 Transcript_38930/m.82922 type:complete len:333 (-) Transcript_38930:472-1470(-)
MLAFCFAMCSRFIAKPSILEVCAICCVEPSSPIFSTLPFKASNLDLTMSSRRLTVEESAFCWAIWSVLCLKDSSKDCALSSAESTNFCMRSSTRSSLPPRISTLLLVSFCCAATSSIIVESSFLCANIESPTVCNCLASASTLLLSALLELMPSIRVLDLSAVALNSCWSTFCCAVALMASKRASSCSTRRNSALLAKFALVCEWNCAKSWSARSTQLVLMLSATAFSREACICMLKSCICEFTIWSTCCCIVLPMFSASAESIFALIAPRSALSSRCIASTSLAAAAGTVITGAAVCTTLGGDIEMRCGDAQRGGDVVLNAQRGGDAVLMT